MSSPPTITVRLSRTKNATLIGFFVLLMIGLGVFAGQKDRLLYLGAAGLLLLASLPAFFDTAPRLVLSAEGLSWRKDKNDGLNFLAWGEITGARFRGGGEDDPRSLQLRLDRPTALERVASDSKDGWLIAIPIEHLEMTERQIMTAIRRRAPHLFHLKVA